MSRLLKKQIAMREKIKGIIFQGLISLAIAIAVYLVTDKIVISLLIAAILLLLVMIQLLVWIMNKLTQRTNWYSNKVGDGLKFRKQIKLGLDICNLGSNSGKFSFDYVNTGLNGENWAVAPQTLSYDFRVLKNYFSFLKKGATVLLPLCPFSGCIKDFDDDRVNHKYYCFLHPVLIQNYSKKTRKRVMRFVNNPFLFSPVKSILRIIRDIPALDCRITNNINWDADANKFVNSWKQQFSITDLDAPVSKQNSESITYNMNLLTEISSFCLERELKPVIIIPPVNKALSSKLSHTFRENYLLPLINSNKSSQAKFLNYIDDERFADYDLYCNAYFLNTKGRKKFTNQVLRDLGLI